MGPSDLFPLQLSPQPFPLFFICLSFPEPALADPHTYKFLETLLSFKDSLGLQ